MLRDAERCWEVLRDAPIFSKNSFKESRTLKTRSRDDQTKLLWWGRFILVLHWGYPWINGLLEKKRGADVSGDKVQPILWGFQHNRTCRLCSIMEGRVILRPYKVTAIFRCWITVFCVCVKSAQGAFEIKILLFIFSVDRFMYCLFFKSIITKFRVGGSSWRVHG